MILDALRYEVAVELTGQLLRETKGRAKISAVQFVPLGNQIRHVRPFAAQLQLTDDQGAMRRRSDGVSTAAREKILKKAHPGNVALTYKALIAMKRGTP